MAGITWPRNFRLIADALPFDGPWLGRVLLLDADTDLRVAAHYTGFEYRSSVEAQADAEEILQLPYGDLTDLLWDPES